ncbi:MAG TPA: zinc-ribbon domain-containing protein [Verrucomicrobiae bacterium]
MKPSRTPETCPSCGADVPINAKACPECGADENTGWKEDSYAGNLGIPEESFDYEDFVKREFEGDKSPKPRGISWLWWAVAIGLVALFLAGYFFRSSK